MSRGVLWSLREANRTQYIIWQQVKIFILFDYILSEINIEGVKVIFLLWRSSHQMSCENSWFWYRTWILTCDLFIQEPPQRPTTLHQRNPFLLNKAKIWFSSHARRKLLLECYVGTNNCDELKKLDYNNINRPIIYLTKKQENIHIMWNKPYKISEDHLFLYYFALSNNVLGSNIKLKLIEFCYIRTRLNVKEKTCLKNRRKGK